MRSGIALLISSLMVAGAAGAQNQVVVTPSNPNGWQTGAYGAGATGGWTSAFPRNGNGSAQITLTDAGSGEFDHFIDFSSPMTLSSVNRLMYDWIRASSSTTANWLAPAFALHMSNANNASDYLIYEYAYNHTGAAPTDTWVTEDILNGIYWRSTGDGSATGACATYGMFTTLGSFNSQCYGGNAMVTGFDIFMGYSIPGTFDAAADNVNFATSNDRVGTNYNFEADPIVTTSPEPATLAFVLPGMLALIPLARRKKA